MKKFMEILGKMISEVAILIFIYELFNVIISICIHQYVRLDGGVLDEVIDVYIDIGIFGCSIALIRHWFSYYLKEEKNVYNATRKILTIYGITFAIMFLLMGLVAKDLLIELFCIASMGIVICVCMLILYIIEKKDINNINKKIKTNDEKKN